MTRKTLNRGRWNASRSREGGRLPDRCCARCKTPGFGCANTNCNCHNITDGAQRMTRTDTARKVRRMRTGAGARINADNIWVYRVIVVLVVCAGLSGVIMSWSGQLYVAGWFILPPALSWTVPVAFDVPIATLALASLAMKSRGRDGVAFWFTVIALTFTAMSSAANFLYVSSHTHLLDYQAWTGAVGKGAAPFITLVMSEVLGVLVTRPKREPSAMVKLRVQVKKLQADLRNSKKVVAE
jgi:phage shock protein PspC (stress-responsive transcriptional regulator)